MGSHIFGILGQEYSGKWQVSVLKNIGQFAIQKWE